jgi:HAE1 family hydrophobic/amphiphilic exporter-1
MAKVIIGGQMLSLVLALLVTPVFYELLDMFVNFTRRLGIRFTVEPTPRPGNQPHVHPNGDGLVLEPEHETAESFA